MTIYPFGYILIIWICCSIIREKTIRGIFYRLFVIELFFALSRMNYGYFIQIGGSELDYNDVLLGILFMISILIISKEPVIPGNTGRSSIFLLLSVLCGMVISYIAPANVTVIDYNHSWDLYLRGSLSQMQQVAFSSQSIMMFFRVLIFVLILNVAYKYFEAEDWIDILNDVMPFMRLLIVYGLLELLLKFGIGINVNAWFNWFFGRGISTGGGLTRLQGISREPSYYALALFNFMVLSLAKYYIDDSKRDRNVNVFWMILAAALGFASSSFSFLVCLVGFLLVWTYLKNFNRESFSTMHWALFVALIGVTMLIFSDSFLGMATNSDAEILNRIAESVGVIKKAFTNTLVVGEDFSSEAARLGGGILSLKAGLCRPLFGLGIGTTYCVTGLICIFANIGIVGLCVWLKLLFGEYGENIPKLLVVFMLFPVLFCNDLYTLYDTSYTLIIPVISVVLRVIQNEKSEDSDLYINKYQEGRGREISRISAKALDQ